MKWNVALARLSNFIERSPPCPNEEHVLRYHAIIGLFEDASGDVLSQFRIAPNRLSSGINDASASYWRSLYSLKFVEYAYFSSLMGGLIGYATHKL
jgi:hypothetical protein